LHIRAYELFTDEQPVVEDRQTRINRVRKQWWERSHLIKDTAVEKYLRRRRGIRIDPLPSSIRGIFAHHKEYGWPFPALVAGLQNVTGGFAGVSVTWLCNDGTAKAPVEPTRKIFGVLSGCAVRLAPAGATLAVCEGIETGLAFQQATGIPTWAALSALNLPNVLLPEVTREVVVAGDNDETGREYARRAEIAFRQSGRNVKVCVPDGRKDFDS
jgi:hypothetical protein